MRAVCPKCGFGSPSINAETTSVKALDGQAEFTGVIYSCSNCNSILGVQMDPLPLQSILISKMLKALGKTE